MIIDWAKRRWNRWTTDPLTGEEVLRHQATYRIPVMLNPGEWVLSAKSWLGKFYLASFDMREAADRLEWDWPSKLREDQIERLSIWLKESQVEVIKGESVPRPGVVGVDEPKQEGYGLWEV